MVCMAYTDHRLFLNYVTLLFTALLNHLVIYIVLFCKTHLNLLLKVLGLLWNLAHKDDVPTDIMDQALNAHIKILDYSCSQVSVVFRVMYLFCRKCTLKFV